jgi:hypothetical protein
MRARQSYGMLKLMGLDELIAQDPDDYVRIAVRLGREPEYRAAVRARIAAHKHVLYDDRGVIKAFVEWLDHELARGRRHDGTAQSTPPVPASSSPRTNEP